MKSAAEKALSRTLDCASGNSSLPPTDLQPDDLANNWKRLALQLLALGQHRAPVVAVVQVNQL